MEIKKSDACFYVGDAPAEATAKIVFEPREPNVIAATETFVDEQWRGQGVAGKLLDELVDYARKEGLKIIPDCSYVKKKFEDDAFADVNAEK